MTKEQKKPRNGAQFPPKFTLCTWNDSIMASSEGGKGLISLDHCLSIKLDLPMKYYLNKLYSSMKLKGFKSRWEIKIHILCSGYIGSTWTVDMVKVKVIL